MRVTYIQTVFLVSRSLFFCCGTEIDSNFSCRRSALKIIPGANCLQPSITLRYPGSLEVYFIFVFIVLKPLKKAQNISLLLHCNVSVLLLLLLFFFFPKGAGEMFSVTTLTATQHAVLAAPDKVTGF